MSDPITPLKMPKWGLSMQEGKIVEWHKSEGDVITEGEDLVDIETSKITNVFESPSGGTLRRIVAKPDETLPVGALVGVLAEPAVQDAEIDAFIKAFQASFVPEAEGEGGGLGLITVAIEGQPMRYGKAGSGEAAPVILLHGFGGDLNGWAAILDRLAEDREVILLDLPGHGGSGKDVGEATMESLAKSVLGLMDHLGLRRAHLVGHSMGAAVALAIAAKAPVRVLSLGLIAPAGVPGTNVSEDFTRGFVEARRARDFKALFESLFDDPRLVTRDLMEEAAKFKRIDGVDAALEKLAARMAVTEFLAPGRRLKEWTKPLFLWASKNDRIVGAPDLSALPPGADIHLKDSASHMPQVEAAPDLRERLAGFLKGAG